MTVNELIEALNHYPGDMRVLVPGYEGGYDDAGLKTEEIVFNVNDKDTWYYGPHESIKFADNYLKVVEGRTGTKCLIVWRGK
jgi:hypothetical protein